MYFNIQNPISLRNNTVFNKLNNLYLKICFILHYLISSLIYIKKKNKKKIITSNNNIEKGENIRYIPFFLKFK